MLLCLATRRCPCHAHQDAATKRCHRHSHQHDFHDTVHGHALLILRLRNFSAQLVTPADQVQPAATGASRHLASVQACVAKPTLHRLVAAAARVIGGRRMLVTAVMLVRMLLAQVRGHTAAAAAAAAAAASAAVLQCD
jgi:hypothetical protein